MGTEITTSDGRQRDEHQVSTPHNRIDISTSIYQSPVTKVTMSETPPWVYGWVDLSCDVSSKEEEEREEEEEEELVSMLREAQSESSLCQSSELSDREAPDFSDFIWDWSSRPNIEPPKQWRRRSKSSRSSPIESRKTSQDSSGEGPGPMSLVSLIVSNIISLIIGTSIGVWLYKKNIWKHSNMFL